MKRKIILLWTCVLICCFFTVTLLSCSSSSVPFGSFKIWDNGWKDQPLTNKDIEHFASNIRATPKNADAYYQLGRYYQERSRHNEAIAEFAKAVTADPASVKAYNAMGVSYDKLGEYENAVQSYDAALAINDNLDYVKNNLGYSYVLQGNPSKAIISLKEALALNSTSKSIHNNLGAAYAMNSQYEEAFSELEIAGGESYAHIRLADFHYKKGNFESAVANYEQAVKNDTPDLAINKRLAAATALANISKPVGVSQDTAPIESGHVVAVYDTAREQAAASRTQEITASPRTNVNIEISNGNGVRKMAKRLSTRLKKRGFNVARLTNAKHFNYSTTRIYYKSGYENEARELSHQMSVLVMTKEASKLDRREIKIKVLIGRDLITYNTQPNEKG